VTTNCGNGCNPNTGLCNNLIPLGSNGCAQSNQCAGSGSSCQGGRCCEFDCAAAGRVCDTGGFCRCPNGSTLVGNTCLLNEGQDCDPNRSGQCASGRCDRWFRDSDDDDHGDPNQSRGVCGTASSLAPDGFVLSSDDCCDRDALANPDQTARHSAANACGSFDFNCNGQVENLFAQTAGGLGGSFCASRPLDTCLITLWSDVIPACGTVGNFFACGQLALQGFPTRCTSVTGGMTANTCR
jgi:hypothetical protein